MSTLLFTTAAPASSVVKGALTNHAAAKVTRLVFVVKEHACDCTRKKIDAAQAALQSVLGNASALPIATLKADTEPVKVEPYRLQKPMLAFPAIYFVDGKSGVVDLLQGDITADQISTALKAHGG